jgi:hypothetical protein
MVKEEFQLCIRALRHFKIPRKNQIADRSNKIADADKHRVGVCTCATKQIAAGSLDVEKFAR